MTKRKEEKVLQQVVQQQQEVAEKPAYQRVEQSADVAMTAGVNLMNQAMKAYMHAFRMPWSVW